MEGELTDEHPVHYKKIHVTYEFTGDDLPMDKLKRAVELSENNYCGVAYVCQTSHGSRLFDRNQL